MDNVKQLGKTLRKKSSESNQNIRRVSENFPSTERTTDSVGPVQSYKKEFNLTNHNHSVNLSVGIAELQKPCIINEIDELITIETTCGGASDIADGFERPVIWTGVDLVTNIGGWTFSGVGGAVVPLSGIYQIRHNSLQASVATTPTQWMSVSVRRNGYILQQETATSAFCGGNCAFFVQFVVNATTYLNAGDVISVWMGASPGLPFYTPYDLCGFFHDARFVATLVGQI